LIQIGDILKVQYLGFVHYGIYTEFGTVIHNSRKGGEVQEVEFYEFDNGREVQKSSITSKDPYLSVFIARQYLGQKYNLLRENCEHFVRKITGKKQSVQVQKYIIATLGALALWKSNDKRVRMLGATALATAFFTDSETSPIENVLTTTGLVGGAMLLTDES
jgi:hypothetical protein